MAFIHTSAGVYVIEIDNSQRTPGNAPTTGVVVGESDKGPVETRQLVVSPQQFIQLFGKPNPKKSFMHYAALAYLEQGNRLYVTRVNDGAFCSGMVLFCRDLSGGLWTNWALENLGFNDPGVVLPDVSVGGFVNPLTQFSFVDPEGLLMFCSVDPGEWGNDIHVEVKDITNRPGFEFMVNVYFGESTVPVESYTVTLQENIDGFGVQQQIETVINRRSKYIRVRVNTQHALLRTLPPDGVIINAVLPPYLLDFGKNGGFTDIPASGNNPAIPASTVRNSAIIGGIADDDTRSGWELYADPELVDVTVLINAGYTAVSVQKRMDAIAQNRMDCFAILDIPRSYQGASSTILSEVDYRRNVLNLDSSYSALYTPDVYIDDPYNNIKLYAPPSGHIGAVYAKTDNEWGNWKDPAGVNRGILNTTLGLYVTYGQLERDIFAEHQINPIRAIRGRGNVVWAADTLQVRPSVLSYIGPRRFMSAMEDLLAEVFLEYVFDNRSESLQSKLLNHVTAYMEPRKQAGAVYWYQAICDATNNPSDVVANGDLIIDVFVQNSISARRIHLNAALAKTGGIRYALNFMSMQGQPVI